jgi:hypothetical protein
MRYKMMYKPTTEIAVRSWTGNAFRLRKALRMSDQVWPAIEVGVA